MPSSSNTSGDEFTITEVRREWTDLGITYWTVFYVRDEEPGWCLQVTGNDELAAYAQAVRKLEGAV